MRFEPEVHTKEFLKANFNILAEIIKNCSEFCESPLVEDLDFLMTVTGTSGDTVAHLLAKHRIEWLNSSASKNIEVLRLDDAGGWNTGWTVAHELATQKEWLKSEASQNKEILMLADKSGVTVAHQLADLHQEWINYDLSKDIEILSLSSTQGRSVAHLLAMKNELWVKSDEARNLDILRLAMEGNITVAHYLARFSPDWLQYEEPFLFEILSLSDEKGITVAHELARFRREWINFDISSDIDVLKLTNKEGDTVAHFLAEWNDEWCFTKQGSNKEILKWANSYGNTVAHALAKVLHWSEHELAQDRDILKLSNKTQWSVAYTLASNEHWITTDASYDKSILSLETIVYGTASHGENKGSVAEQITKKGFETIPEVALRLIRKGAGYKHSHLLCKIEWIDEIINETDTLINDHQDVQLKIKFCIAAYSTLRHFISSAERVFVNLKWEQEEKEELLKELRLRVNSYTSKLTSLLDLLPESDVMIDQFKDINCEPAIEIIQKFLNEREFRTLPNFQLDDLLEQNPEPLSTDIF